MVTTRKTNVTKISNVVLNQIREERITLGISYAELGKKYRISKKSAWNICNRQDVTPELKIQITNKPSGELLVTPPKKSEGKTDAKSVIEKSFELMYYKMDLELTNLQAGAKPTMAVKDIANFIEVAAPFAIPKVESTEVKGKGKKPVSPNAFDMFKPKTA